MHDAASGQGPVIDMRQQKWWAADLRKHLERGAHLHGDAVRPHQPFILAHFLDRHTGHLSC